MPEKIPAWAARYVGIPFADAVEESAGGLHCWGLVRLVLARAAGLDLPAYGEIGARELAALALFAGEAAREPWLPVMGPPRALDVALMRGPARAVSHCGIMVSPSHVLHVEAAHDSVVVAVSHPSVRRRLIGFFRHRALAGRDLGTVMLRDSGASSNRERRS